MKRILVAGGAGFIGSHLCKALLTMGHQVTCLDNFYTGNRRNLLAYLEHPHFTLLEQDVCTPLNIPTDLIFNLACPASPIHYQKDPIYTMKVNFLGALHLLENADRYKATFLQASTSEVYGDPSVHPQSESYWGNVNCFGPRACYDEGKRCAETLSYDFHHQKNLDIRIARIFNTYGPQMDPLDGRVVCNFIVQALKGEDLTIYGTGLQTRSFCYVSDLVNGLISLASTPNIHTPINLGNPVEYTMLEIAEKIIQLTNSKSKIAHHPLPQDDPTQRKPNIQQAKTLLNWQPEVYLEEGLEKTIHYFKNFGIMTPFAERCLSG